MYLIVAESFEHQFSILSVHNSYEQAIKGFNDLIDALKGLDDFSREESKFIVKYKKVNIYNAKEFNRVLALRKLQQPQRVYC